MLACLAAAVLAGLACQKENIKIKGTPLSTLVDAGKVLPAAIPVDLPGALAAARTWFQTRGEIAIAIDSDQISLTSSLQLFNTTTGVSLISAPNGAFGLRDNAAQDPAAAWGLTDLGYKFELTIYPLDPNFVGKFAYGPNQLTLDIDESTNPKAAEQAVTMNDFQYFSQLYSSFATNDEQVEGFQGELVTVSGPFVNNGDYELSNGFVGILNR